MPGHWSDVTLIAVTLTMTLLFAHLGVFGTVAKPSDPIFGTWKLDQTKSVNNRSGDHAAVLTQHLRILRSEGDGLRNILANTPTSPLVYSYSAKFDGKDHPDRRSEGKNQTLASRRSAVDLDAQRGVYFAPARIKLEIPLEGAPCTPSESAT